MTGVELIAAERQRQIEVEGWTAEHDDERTNDLATAGGCYAFAASWGYGMDGEPWVEWPWRREFWKPSSKIRMLVKAGAMIAAAIDSLQRKGIG